MPQLGSFGEAVYEQFMSGTSHAIHRLHMGRADFEVNGERVDVKTSRQQFEVALERPVITYRHKLPGTRYAILEFHQGGALLSEEQQVQARIGWAFLAGVFQKWRDGAFGKRHQIKKANRSGLSPEIVEMTERIFAQHGHGRPYLLYRTVMFNKESPHNLLPSQRKPKCRLGFTVFFVFHRAPPELSNLKEIVAFPDSADAELPRLEKLRTAGHIANLEKADIDLIPRCYRFGSFEELRRLFVATGGQAAQAGERDECSREQFLPHPPRMSNPLR